MPILIEPCKNRKGKCNLKKKGKVKMDILDILDMCNRKPLCIEQKKATANSDCVKKDI